MSFVVLGEALITYVVVVASYTTTIYNFCKIVGEALRDRESRRVAASPKE